MEKVLVIGLFAMLLSVCGLEGQGGAGTGEKTIVLDSSDPQRSAFSFSKGEYAEWMEGDISNEPWCTEDPGICGNWVDLGAVQLNEIGAEDIPDSGYLSEGGYVDCEYVKVGHTYINKNEDGTYYAFEIIDDEYSESESECNHKTTIKYVRLK